MCTTSSGPLGCRNLRAQRFQWTVGWNVRRGGNSREEGSLTPPQERCKAPGERVQPDEGYIHPRAFLGGPLDGLQWFGDHNVAINGDGQEVYHGGYSKPSSAEGIDFTACRRNLMDYLYFIQQNVRISQSLWGTCFAENPALVKGVDEEDGRLCDRHEEVADGQVQDEEVGWSLQLLVTETRHHWRVSNTGRTAGSLWSSNQILMQDCATNQ